MSIHDAIAHANAILPGAAAPDGETDPRWQALIVVGEFIESHPREIWEFVDRWGRHEDADLSQAVATVLLEHLLEHHFELIFPRTAEAARNSREFASTFLHCWKFGQSELPGNSEKFDALVKQCRKRWENEEGRKRSGNRQR